MNSMNTNENDNVSKPPRNKVDAEALRLATKYGNGTFQPYYCKVIYTLGLQRVREIEGRVSDAKFPGRLFTKIANEEVAARAIRK